MKLLQFWIMYVVNAQEVIKVYVCISKYCTAKNVFKVFDIKKKIVMTMN